jgi:hypothetical protein
MIFLPVVERELRVSARKRSTFWVRVIGAALAMTIGAGFLILTRLTPAGLGGPLSGSGLFAALTWMSLAGALAAGVFLTSDCLSEEKRDGTMGLLFLTDLRGHDVVLGKLLATSLRAGCAMLGVFPVLAITLLMGGVSATQFWRTCLALASALLISLATGLMVSAISRVSQKALAATLLLLLILTAAGPSSDALIAGTSNTAFIPLLSHSSPVFLFMTASDPAGSPHFGKALTVNALIAGALLGSAFVALPGSWQQRNRSSASAFGGWMRWWKFGGHRVRESGRRTLMDANPVLWLASRERWQAAALWCIAILQAGAGAAVLHRAEMPVWMLWSYLTSLLSLLLYLGLASHAGRFFVETRRNGLIELMLATPLTAREIIRGQWRALLRMFGLPLSICLLTQWIGDVLVQQMTWEQLSASVTATPGTPGATAAGPGLPGLGLAFAAATGGTLTVAANLTAICWFGMWMGLTSKNTNLATLKTILYVQVIPWFAISFAAGMIIPLLLIPIMMRGGANPPTRFFLWLPLLSTGLATILNVGKDTCFVAWSRRKLHRELRERVGLKVWPTPAS